MGGRSSVCRHARAQDEVPRRRAGGYFDLKCKLRVPIHRRDDTPDGKVDESPIRIRKHDYEWHAEYSQGLELARRVLDVAPYRSVNVLCGGADCAL